MATRTLTRAHIVDVASKADAPVKPTRKPRATMRTDKAGYVTLLGKDGAARTEAFMGIAPNAFTESVSRVEMVRSIRVALGNKPTDDELAAARTEYVIGRVAARLHVSEFPRADMKTSDKLAHVRDVVCFYAVPVKDGVKARPLTGAHKGRRSPAQHKAILAATEAWSQVKAELGYGAAQTQAQRNAAKKRQPMKAGSAGSPDASKAPTLTPAAELLKGPMTSTDAMAYLDGMAATMLAFANKHAKVLPTDYGAACRAFSASIIKAAALAKSVSA